MNIKELKEFIKDLPDYMDVVITQNNDEFENSLAESANVITVTFGSPEMPEDEWAKDECLSITD